MYGLPATALRVTTLLRARLGEEHRVQEPIPVPPGIVLLNGFVLESTAPEGYASGWHLGGFEVRLGAPVDGLLPCLRRIRPARSPDFLTDAEALGRWPLDQPTEYRLHLDLLVLGGDATLTARTFAAGATDVVDFADTGGEHDAAATRRNRTLQGVPGRALGFPALLGFGIDLEDPEGDRDGRFLRAFAARVQSFDYDPEAGRGHLVPLLRFSNRGLVPLAWNGVLTLHTAMVQAPEGASTPAISRGGSARTGGAQEHRCPWRSDARDDTPFPDSVLPEGVVERAGCSGTLLSDLLIDR